MKLVHIVGRRNHGKTTLILDLLPEYGRRGLKVGAIKHSPHAHELDTPGKDSFRYRQAGASPSAVTTPGAIAVFLTRGADESPYALLAPVFADADVVLVEGDLDGPGPFVEVWRAEFGKPSLAVEHGDVCAVISDDVVDVAVPVWPRSNLSEVADRILTLAGVAEAGGNS